MSDNLAIIDRVILEHQRIRGDLQHVGESTNDLEAIFSLQQVYSGWTLSSPGVIEKKQEQLRLTMAPLEEGLNKHFAFEELALPPLFGDLLMQALLVEHRQIKNQIAEAKSLIADTRFLDMGQEQLLVRKGRIQQVIGALNQGLEEHAAREETILNMMKRALVDKGQG